MKHDALIVPPRKESFRLKDFDPAYTGKFHDRDERPNTSFVRIDSRRGREIPVSPDQKSFNDFLSGPGTISASCFMVLMFSGIKRATSTLPVPAF